MEGKMKVAVMLGIGKMGFEERDIVSAKIPSELLLKIHTKKEALFLKPLSKLAVIVEKGDVWMRIVRHGVCPMWQMGNWNSFFACWIKNFLLPLHETPPHKPLR